MPFASCGGNSHHKTRLYGNVELLQVAIVRPGRCLELIDDDEDDKDDED